MSILPDLPFSDPVRLNQIPGGVTRRLEPDAAARGRIARALDLASLDAFVAEMTLKPVAEGWRLTGRITAGAVQTCGLSLEPLPVEIDSTFSITLSEAVETESEEIVITVEDDSPDLIEDGRIDLGQYAVEQLALRLDPFPRKPGAEFVQPPEPAEISPFAVLRALHSKDTPEQG
ncbi:MAG: YceD family protein [Brevundimonas sp.]